MIASRPDNPVGPFQMEMLDQQVRASLTQAIKTAPQQLRASIAGLSNSQLDTKYKNWTIRQIVHHLADSHVHSYIRFKWTLTEKNPTIKAYEESDWVELDDARFGDPTPAVALFDALHGKWTQLLETMTDVQFSKTFVHPQSGETVDLWTAMNYYPWHARHHTGQILWLREHHGW